MASLDQAKIIKALEAITRGSAEDFIFAREVLPYNPDAWIDHGKTKVATRFPSRVLFMSTKP